MTHSYDAVIIGAGAAGLFCAGAAGQLGLKVLLIDHSAKVAEKIRISGGGRANFTNREATPANYLGENPHFCRRPWPSTPAATSSPWSRPTALPFMKNTKASCSATAVRKT
jgi:glycine/D-amino acid oxidase-like deaminating enzyme